MADLRLTDLGEVAALSDAHVTVVDNGTATNKVTLPQLREYMVGALTDLTTTVKTNIVAAINEIKAQADKCECLVLTQASISALPVTISNAAIDTDMVVINAVLSNPAAQTADWTVNTDTAGQATISGTISGTTNLTLYLMKSR